MDGFGFSLALGALKALAFVYDVLTFPVYIILQRPWRVRQLSRRLKGFIVDIEQEKSKELAIDMKDNKDLSKSVQQRPPKKFKAKQINQDTKSVTYRSLVKPTDHHVTIIREKIDTMAKMLDYCSKKYANKRCLGTREILAEEDEVQRNGRVFKKFVLGDYRWKTFAEVNILADNFGKGLCELGNEPGKNVAIFAETRAEWMIAAHGFFKYNIPLVTIYATLGDEAIAHAINETEVTTIVTSYDLMPKFKKILHMTPRVQTLIYMEDQLKNLESTNGFKDDVAIYKFQDVLQKGCTSNIQAEGPKTEDIAIIMYTSGSTGVPKGVMLLHKNLTTTLRGFCDCTPIYDNDIMMGFLPLAHVFELLVESVCLFAGVPIGYSGALTMTDSSSKIKKGTKGDATVLCPTVITSVPLILDRIFKTIQEKVNSSNNLKKLIFKFAYEYKTTWSRRGYQTPIINKFVFKPISNILGGNLRLMISGGAPLSVETHEQISTCMCVVIIQGYGLTETTSCASAQDPHDITYGKVGAPCTTCDIKLINWEEGNYRVTDKPHPRGEIIIGGDIISAGYYKLPEKSKEEFFEQDGTRWFRTGDIGEFLEDGVLRIIDRKKDLVKLQAGEYVSLGKVEAEMKTCPLVDNICVYGESSKDYCVALVVPNQQQLKDLAAKKGISEKPFEDLCRDQELEKAVVQELAEHGKRSKLAKFEIPGAVKLVTEVWSPDMGLVTAAFKLKRKDIQERYKHEINRMYAS